MRLKPNILGSWFTRYMECSKDSSMKIFEFFGTVRPMENCVYTHFCSKNLGFFKNVFIDIMFNLLISFRPNSNHILSENTKTVVIT